MNTKAERANIETLRSDLDSTSTKINVSNLFLCFTLPLLSTLTSFFIQKIIEYFQSKDKFIRATLKRLTKTQILEDELIEVTALNKVLLAWKQELETQLVEASREKAGKCFAYFYHA
jgi:hypothetical protein